MSADVPHFAVPFQLGPAGANVNEQDSLDDIAACVVAIASTHVGWRAEVPEFGIPDLVFRKQTINADDINSWISAQEQRAALVVTAGPDQVDNLISRVNIGVSLIAKGAGVS